MLSADLPGSIDTLATMLREFKAFPVAVFDALVRMFDWAHAIMAKTGQSESHKARLRSLIDIATRCVQLALDNEVTSVRQLYFAQTWLGCLLRNGRAQTAHDTAAQLLLKMPYASSAGIHGYAGIAALALAKQHAGITDITHVKVVGSVASFAAIIPLDLRRTGDEEEDDDAQSRPAAAIKRKVGRPPKAQPKRSIEGRPKQKISSSSAAGADEEEERDGAAGNDDDGDDDDDAATDGNVGESDAEAAVAATFQTILFGAAAAPVDNGDDDDDESAAGKENGASSAAASAPSDNAVAVKKKARRVIPKVKGAFVIKPGSGWAVTLTLSASAVHGAGSVETLLQEAEKQFHTCIRLSTGGAPAAAAGSATALPQHAIVTNLATTLWLMGRPNHALAVCRAFWRKQLGGLFDPAAVPVLESFEDWDDEDAPSGGVWADLLRPVSPHGSPATLQPSAPAHLHERARTPLLLSPSVLAVLRHAHTLYALLRRQRPATIAKSADEVDGGCNSAPLLSSSSSSSSVAAGMSTPTALLAQVNAWTHRRGRILDSLSAAHRRSVAQADMAAAAAAGFVSAQLAGSRPAPLSDDEQAFLAALLARVDAQ